MFIIAFSLILYFKLTLKNKTMLKKITFLILTVCLLQLNAQEVASKKGMITRGFFLNIGIAFPSQTFTADKATLAVSGSTAQDIPFNKTSYKNQFYGVQPSIEIGNQWYFWRNPNMGIGLRVSWLQFGASSFQVNEDILSEKLNANMIDFRLLKLAPQFTYAFNEKMALDVSFEVAPTVFFGFGSKTKGDTTLTYANTTIGLLFAPGLKFRYKKLAIGTDIGFGTPFSFLVLIDEKKGSTSNTTATLLGSSSTLYPRIYAGFKF